MLMQKMTMTIPVSMLLPAVGKSCKLTTKTLRKIIKLYIHVVHCSCMVEILTK